MSQAIHDAGNEIGGIIVGDQGSWKLGGYDWVHYCPVRRSMLDKVMTQVHMARIVTGFHGDILVLGESAAHLAPIAYLVRALWRQKYKIVIDVRTLPIPIDENSNIIPKATLFWGQLKAGFPFSDAWMAITPRLRDAVKKRIATRNLPCLVWESAVDRKFLETDGVSPAANILSCGHEINVLYLGVLAKCRRVDLAIRAMAEFENKSGRVGLHIVGSGDHVPDLKLLVAELGLSKTVHIWDPVPYPQVPSTILACDLGILPLPDCDAWNTSSALKLYEYMGVGRPILVSDISAHRHAVGGQPFAFFMKDYSAAGFNEALRRFIEQPKAVRQALGEQARAFVREHHTYDHRAKVIHRFLTSVLLGQA